MSNYSSSASNGDRSFSVAVDTGGTFTDVSLIDRSTGRKWKAKTSSTPDDPSRGFIAGISEVLAIAEVSASQVSHVFHGTTVATNAILEMKGARTALLTTSGFKHVIEIGRHDSPRSANIYSWIKPQRPVSPDNVHEIRERLNASGESMLDVQEEDVKAAVAHMREVGIESVAICYLHAYRNPAHELETKAIVERIAPEMMVSLSSDILPVFREYERSMATVLNAYVMPKIAGYVERLEDRLREAGIDARLLLMKSNGGVAGVATIRDAPIHTALSGPAAGIVGAENAASLAGQDRIITLDIGGTSADICLIDGGTAATTTAASIGDWPIAFPILDISTIGAGGGSLASVEDGMLRVGPESAGAVPGPVCYGRGGTVPTVTDAHLVLGHLPRTLLGGAMALDHDAALQAIQGHVAEPLGLTAYEAARGIIDIANNNMIGAIRIISVERGLDPAAFALLPFGGAGPLHGGFIARLLGMKAMIVPPAAGVLSSAGLLLADLRNEFSRSCVMQANEDAVTTLDAYFKALDKEGNTWLSAEAVAQGSRERRWTVSMRYQHQGFELDVPWPAPEFTAKSISEAVDRFHALHRRLYGFDQRDTLVEITSVRVEAIGRPPAPRGETLDGSTSDASIMDTQTCYFEGQFLECNIHDRRALAAGNCVIGPAIVSQLDATTFILPGQIAMVDTSGSLIVTEANA